MNPPYPFVEWSADRCIDRQQELIELDGIPHNPDRATRLAHELFHITQEIDWKHEEQQHG